MIYLEQPMFRFTIRDMLWLIVVVALGLGWWVDRWLLAKVTAKLDWQVRQLTQHIRDGGETVDLFKNGILIGERPGLDKGDTTWYPEFQSDVDAGLSTLSAQESPKP